MRRIILLGYMGAGKTTLGEALAKALALDFCDLDWYIESRTQRSVAQIFADDGEEGFRNIERNMMHEVVQRDNIVLSCGGGTPCFFDNIDYLNQKGETVYLKATPEVIYAHLKMGNVVRPLLKDKTQEEVEKFVNEQLTLREPYYNKAKHTCNVEILDTDEKIATSVERIKKTITISEDNEEMDC